SVRQHVDAAPLSDEQLPPARVHRARVSLDILLAGLVWSNPDRGIPHHLDPSRIPYHPGRRLLDVPQYDGRAIHSGAGLSAAANRQYLWNQMGVLELTK